MQAKIFDFDYDKFDIERPFDFSFHSSFGCGGCAKLAVYPKTEEEFCRLMEELRRSGQEWIVVGNLTNVLVSDLGTDKIVICTKKLAGLRMDGETAYAEAGVLSGKLLFSLRKASLSGAEFLTGIPCTLGGALYMNAGAGGKYISEIVQSVRVYRAGNVLDLPIDECAYGYKRSAFMKNGDVLLGGTLRLQKSDLHTVAENERTWRERRKHLPRGKSAGCIFKNPNGVSAGEMIERAGLKGLRIGGAKVSELHANFIVNDGNATAKEVKTLIELIKNAVYAYCGTQLEEEIRYI